MKKILGIFALLVAICLVTTAGEPKFVTPINVENLIRWTALFGIISIGVSFVIITGGIDLSIGSIIGLTGCLMPILLAAQYVPSGDSVQVTEVAAGEKQLVVAGAVDLIPGDHLVFTPATGRTRSVTVDEVSAAGEQLTIQTRESPGFLKPGAALTVAYFNHRNVVGSFVVVMLVAAGIGLIHGLLITKLRLQPFVVTLCGLLIYRGMARFLANDDVKGFGTEFLGLRYLALGRPFSIPVPFIGWIADGNWSRYPAGWQEGSPTLPVFEWIAVPMPVLIVAAIALVAAVFLNYTIYGRYLQALGRNEQAARYSGINTDRMVIFAYVICALMAGLAGVLFALDVNSVQPSAHGYGYELYAIAAAVLGGCSLRGGEGSILGVLVGTAVMRAMNNSINMLGIPDELEYVVIGTVILIGVIADESAKRLAARRRARAVAVVPEKAAA